MSVVTLQIWFATSFHPGKKETLVGMTWRLINGEITEGFHPYSAGSVKNSGVEDFKVLERMFPIIKKRILKQQISRSRVDLQIYSNNISLVHIFQNLVLPPTDKQILNTFRLVQEELKKFHSYEFGWIERKSNPAVKPLREWIKSNKGYGPEVPSVEEINQNVTGTRL